MADILFLAQRLPFPPNKGEKIRAFHILKHLAARHRVHLGCFVDDPQDWQHVEALKDYCVTVHAQPLSPLKSQLRALPHLMRHAPLTTGYYWSRALAAWVARINAARRPQGALIYSSAMARYLDGLENPPARRVMDFVDVDSDKWAQYARSKSWPMNWVYGREARTLLAFDRAQAQTMSACTFVSDAEADLFRSLAPESADKTFALPNGVDSSYFEDANIVAHECAGAHPVLLFTGTMDYWPNEDAVIWFAREVLPLVQKQYAKAAFYIVGARPTPAVQELGNLPGVTVTGRVADVRPYLAAADVVVAPVRLARGVQNKVLEGMAMAKPVVTTPQGLEGIDAEIGTHLLVGETEAQLAEATIRACQPLRAQKLGRAARKLITERYAWEAALSRLDEFMGL